MYLTLTGTGAYHVDDRICGKRGKAVCDGTDGELVNDLLHFDNPDRVVFIHLNDAAKSEMRYVKMKVVRAESCRRKCRCDLEPCLETSQRLDGVFSGVGVER